MEAQCAAMREVLEATLQSHVRLGQAFQCECSLCRQIREVLRAGAGAAFAARLREECAQVADWKAATANSRRTEVSPGEAELLKAMAKAARDIGDSIRVLNNKF